MDPLDIFALGGLLLPTLGFFFPTCLCCPSCPGCAGSRPDQLQLDVPSGTIVNGSMDCSGWNGTFIVDWYVDDGGSCYYRYIISGSGGTWNGWLVRTISNGQVQASAVVSGFQRVNFFSSVTGVPQDCNAFSSFEVTYSSTSGTSCAHGTGNVFVTSV